MNRQEKNLIKDLIEKVLADENCDKTTKMVALSILEKLKNE